MSSPADPVVMEIVHTLAALSAAWRERRYDDLAAYLEANMVFASPGLGAQLDGREAVVASYREFMDRATLREYQETDLVVDVWGETAVARYRWTMGWLAGGVERRESGHDVFVLRRCEEDSAWRVVWRTMLFEASATA